MANRLRNDTLEQPVLKLSGLSREFTSATGEKTAAVDNVDLEIGAGELVVIRGISGSGKTTLLKVLGLLDREYEGKFYINGEDIDQVEDWYCDEIRSHNMSFIFQDGELFDHLSIRENIDVPYALRSEPKSLQCSSENTELSSVLFTNEELDNDILDRRPTNVSGGQKQRASIWRAVAPRTPILFADEPTASLDPKRKQLVKNYFNELVAAGYSIVVVTHDKIFFDVGTQYKMVYGKLKRLKPLAEKPQVATSLGAPNAIETEFDALNTGFGFWPRSSGWNIILQIFRETTSRVLFSALILAAVVLGVTQVSVMSSLIQGADQYVDYVVTKGSRLNRIQIKPLSKNRRLENRFPNRTDISQLPGVREVVPRRTSIAAIKYPDGNLGKFTAVGLVDDDPEYKLLPFLAGGGFSSQNYKLEVIVTAGLLGDLFPEIDSGGDFDIFLERTIEIRVPKFNERQELTNEVFLTLNIVGVIQAGEGGRDLYLPSRMQRIIERYVRDRKGEVDLPVNAAGDDWHEAKDKQAILARAEYPWEDELHLYMNDIKLVIPMIRDLSAKKYKPKSDIWRYKWALDIGELTRTIFNPLLWLIVITVSGVIFANIFTVAKVREREFALWRILGMRKGDLVIAQLGSVLLLVLVGLLIGLAISHQLIVVGQQLLAEQYAELEANRIFADLTSYATWVAVGAVGIGLTAALWPSYRIANTNPATLLNKGG